MNALIPTVNPVTMTSLEISELTGSRHDSVKRAIETLSGKGVIEFPQSVEIPTATRPAAAYLFTGDKGRRDSIIVVAQLCPEFTARLVDRWQDLEAKLAKPVELSRMDILQLAIDSERGRLAAVEQLAIAAPKAEALDLLTLADGAMCITNAAKSISKRPKDLFAWMQSHDWIYRRPGGSSWCAYQERIKSGLLTHKVTTVSRSDGTEKIVEQVLVTAKGLAKLAEAAA